MRARHRSNNTVICVSAVFAWFVLARCALCAAGDAKSLLREGFVLRAAAGRLIPPDSNNAAGSEKWFFALDGGISDGVAQVEAGTPLELLPSSGLEKMTLDANNRRRSNYRLLAKVTKYKGKNYLFPIHFIAIAEKTVSAQETPQQPQPQESQPIEDVEKGLESAPALNEPNDIIRIPQEVMTRFGEAGISRTDKPAAPPRLDRNTGADSPVRHAGKTNAEPEKRGQPKQDSILVDRLGLIRGQNRDKAGTAETPGFCPDGIGQSIGRERFRLLPCEALEQAEQQQSAQIKMEQVRFKVSGIVTEYRGERYLLLQKAMRTYSCGNFGQ